MEAIIKSTQCQYCGQQNDAISSLIGDTQPHDGDLTMCVGCGKFSVIDGSRDEGIRVLTPAENFEIKRSKMCQEIYLGWLITKNG